MLTRKLETKFILPHSRGDMDFVSFIFCSYESEEGGSQNEEYSSIHSYKQFSVRFLHAVQHFT